MRAQRSPKGSQRPGGLRVRGRRGFADIAHAEGEDEDGGEEEGRKRGLPHPAHGILHCGRIEGPDPRRPDGNAAAVTAGGDLIDTE